MDKHFELDALVYLVGFYHCIFELGQSFVIIILRIYNKYQRSAATKDHVGVKGRLNKVNLTRKIPYLKLHKAGIVDVVLDDLAGGL